jgi:hypothetical protein
MICVLAAGFTPYTLANRGAAREPGRAGWKRSGLLSMEGTHERVAQSVEHVTFNHGVVGSIPTALTNARRGNFRVLAQVRRISGF